MATNAEAAAEHLERRPLAHALEGDLVLGGAYERELEHVRQTGVLEALGDFLALLNGVEHAAELVHAAHELDDLGLNGLHEGNVAALGARVLDKARTRAAVGGVLTGEHLALLAVETRVAGGKHAPAHLAARGALDALHDHERLPAGHKMLVEHLLVCRPDGARAVDGDVGVDPRFARDVFAEHLNRASARHGGLDAGVVRGDHDLLDARAHELVGPVEDGSVEIEGDQIVVRHRCPRFGMLAAPARPASVSSFPKSAL